MLQYNNLCLLSHYMSCSLLTKRLINFSMYIRRYKKKKSKDLLKTKPNEEGYLVSLWIP